MRSFMCNGWRTCCRTPRPVAQRVIHRRPLGAAAAGGGGVALARQAQCPRVKGQVDDPGAVRGGVGDAVGDGLRQPAADRGVRH